MTFIVLNYAELPEADTLLYPALSVCPCGKDIDSEKRQKMIGVSTISTDNVPRRQDGLDQPRIQSVLTPYSAQTGFDVERCKCKDLYTTCLEKRNVHWHAPAPISVYAGTTCTGVFL